MPAGAPPAGAAGLAALLGRRRRALGPSLSLAYRAPLLDRARLRTTLCTTRPGREYLDMVNNVAHVGHCHPRVVAAGRRQMAVLNTNTRVPPPVDRAVRGAARRDAAGTALRLLLRLLRQRANELALRLARRGTGRRGVVVVGGAYHGNTQTSSGQPYKFDGPAARAAGARRGSAPMPDDYRGLYRRDDPRRGSGSRATCARPRRAARRGAPPAAFLCESLLSCGGQIVLPPATSPRPTATRARRAPCASPTRSRSVRPRRDAFWGFETQGVVPDVVTMGKPIGNGHPLAAVVTTPAIAAAFANGMEYFNTFGGNPVSCEIGLAVLDVVRDEALQERARRTAGGCDGSSRSWRRGTRASATCAGSGCSSASSSSWTARARTPDATARPTPSSG
jgi:4-aminobutyrate aminotransferase-like enzyme